VKYLVDTNIFLELSLRRSFWESVREFFVRIPAAELAVSSFTLHSLGVFLSRRTPVVFDAIVSDLLEKEIAVIGIEPSDLHLVTKNVTVLGWDFDDAFIYTVAVQNGLQIVSFDRAPLGRQTLSQILANLPN
jgi:predicted nucleic acid-binding protein